MTEELLSALTRAWIATILAAIAFFAALGASEMYDRTSFLHALQNVLANTPM